VDGFLRKPKSKDSDTLLIGEDLQKIDYRLSTCCNPIPGDDVFGFVTVSEGIKIHRTNCPNAAKLMSNYGYRIVKAKWDSQKELAFLTGLRITGIDDVGLINSITTVISNDFKVNMRSITVDSYEGIFDGSIMVFVNDTVHLELLITRLKELKGVTSVTRYDTPRCNG
jgi:GTP pyrophosphokinase